VPRAGGKVHRLERQPRKSERHRMKYASVN
jgi:hypothetical protein